MYPLSAASQASGRVALPRFVVHLGCFVVQWSLLLALVFMWRCWWWWVLLFCCSPAVLRGVLESQRVGEHPGERDRGEVRVRRALRGPAAHLLLLPSAR